MLTGDLGEDEVTSSDSDDVVMSSSDPREDGGRPRPLMLEQKHQSGEISPEQVMDLMLYTGYTSNSVGKRTSLKPHLEIYPRSS